MIEMKIKELIIKETFREIKFSNYLDSYVDVTNIDNPIQGEISDDDNPLLGQTYYMPYDWRNIAQSNNDPQRKVFDLFIKTIKQASKTELQYIYDRMIKPNNHVDCHNMSLTDIFSDPTNKFDIDNFSDYYYIVAPLINKYTSKRMIPISVWTCGTSVFQLKNEFSSTSTIQDNNEAFLLLDAKLLSDKPKHTKTILKNIMTDYTDYFNGHIYEIITFNNLEDAINNQNQSIHNMKANEFYLKFKASNQLVEIT